MFALSVVITLMWRRNQWVSIIYFTSYYVLKISCAKWVCPRNVGICNKSLPFWIGISPIFYDNLAISVQHIKALAIKNHLLKYEVPDLPGRWNMDTLRYSAQTEFFIKRPAIVVHLLRKCDTLITININEICSLL